MLRETEKEDPATNAGKQAENQEQWYDSLRAKAKGEL